MNIHVLGSGAYPLRWENGRSLSILFPDHQLIIDGGLGLTALPEDYSAAKLTIILSHYHHDHILGLAFLANILERGNIKSVSILGDKRIEKLGLFFQEPFNPDYTSQQMPVTMGFLPEEFSIGTMSIRRKQVPHASGFSNYFVLNDGSTQLAFGTDTTATTDTANFIKGSKALIHECNFDNTHKARAIAEGHSYPDAVTSLAKAADIEQLYLLHTDPRYPAIEQETKKQFPSARILRDDDKLSVSSR